MNPTVNKVLRLQLSYSVWSSRFEVKNPAHSLKISELENEIENDSFRSTSPYYVFMVITIRTTSTHKFNINFWHKFHSKLKGLPFGFIPLRFHSDCGLGKEWKSRQFDCYCQHNLQFLFTVTRPFPKLPSSQIF